MKHTEEEKIFRSKMSLNLAFRLITYLIVYGIGVALPAIIGVIYTNIFDNSLFLLFPIPFIGIFFSLWLSSPKAVSLTKDLLRIERPIGYLNFKLSEIKKVEKLLVLQDYTGFALRLWGSGGAWGNFGYFWSKRLGIFKLYLTNNNFVLIEMENGKKIFVSPDKIDPFVEKIKKLKNKKK